LIDALVAAEDHNYWTHGGMDFKAFVVAMLDNMKSRSLKRGGSTLSQATAKNAVVGGSLAGRRRSVPGRSAGQRSANMGR
jgi:membrane peptidoglycan carboxypeptidase